jgi:hypothetical protein
VPSLSRVPATRGGCTDLARAPRTSMSRRAALSAVLTGGHCLARAILPAPSPSPPTRTIPARGERDSSDPSSSEVMRDGVRAASGIGGRAVVRHAPARRLA